jgi:hypothetical protein
LIKFRKEHKLGKTLTMVSTICIKEEIWLIKQDELIGYVRINQLKKC